MIAQLSESLARARLIVVARGDKLLLRGPDTSITPELMADLRKHRPDLLKWCQSIEYFKCTGASAQSVSELYAVLSAFSKERWTLIERAAMSANYTPRSLDLIQKEGVDRYKTLEDLFALCWSHYTADGDGAEGNNPAGYQNGAQKGTQ